MEVNLDLRVAGSIDLGDSGSRERARIEGPPRGLRSLDRERRSFDPDGANGVRQSREPSRHEQEAAAKNTRQVMVAVKQALKSEDAQRIRQETGRLKEATVRLGEAVKRGGAAKDPDEERTSGVVIDAEIEEAEKRDRKEG